MHLLFSAMRTATALLCGAALAATAAGSPLWDYVNTPDSAYKWVDTGYRYNETGTLVQCT